MTGNISAKSAVRGARRGTARLSGKLFGPLGVFLQGAIENPGMVGAVFPSTRATVDGMLERVDWANCKVVVEYGPGVGTFTNPILALLPADARLIAIDTSAHFIDHLKETIDDSRFSAVLGSAADVEAIVERAGFGEPDVVVSGLPFSSLPENVATQIVEASYRALKPGGAFLTYQYRLAARRLTEQVFDRVDTKVSWKSVPPNSLTWGWKAA